MLSAETPCLECEQGRQRCCEIKLLQPLHISWPGLQGSDTQLGSCRLNFLIDSLAQLNLVILTWLQRKPRIKGIEKQQLLNQKLGVKAIQ